MPWFAALPSSWQPRGSSRPEPAFREPPLTARAANGRSSVRRSLRVQFDARDEVNDSIEIAKQRFERGAPCRFPRPTEGPKRKCPILLPSSKPKSLDLARKEVRENSDGLRKTVATQRTEVASLKRRLQQLESVVKKLAKGQGAISVRPGAAASSESGESNGAGLRFRAKGMAANRKRLGLSAADFGLLVGTTGLLPVPWTPT